jgi:solute carrier family 35 protein F1/2
MICLGGLGMLVISDKLTGKNNRASSKVKGDALMFAGAVLYGFSAFSVLALQLDGPNANHVVLANATEEYLVRQRPLYEVQFHLSS